MTFEQLVDNSIDSYNSYGKGAREKMFEGVQKRIDEIDGEIKKVYQTEEAKKYPLRMDYDETRKMAGESKRMSAFQFVNSLSPNIKAGNYMSEQLLINEIKNAINIDDRDTASNLLDSADIILPSNNVRSNSKFYSEITEIKKSYQSKIGIEDISKKIKELETRKSEFQFIQSAINKNDDIIVLPRHWTAMFPDGLPNNNPKIKEVAMRLLPFVNKSMEFLSSKKANLRS